MPDSSKPIRIASIGLNFGAHASREIKRHPKMELAVVCDLDAAKAQKLADELETQPSSSYEEVLADPTIEAVALFTPPHLHAQHITMAAEAGKHIVCTKPLEISSEKAVQAIDKAEAAGLVVMSNSPPPRYIGNYAIVKDAMDEGRLGKPVQISGYTWARYDNMEPDGTWYDDPDACPGGPLYRLGIYIINFANAFLGRPVEVYAQQSWIRSKRPTPDHANLVVRYDSGALMNLAVSLSVGGAVYPDTCLVAGTDGAVVINPEFSSGDSGDKKYVVLQGRKKSVHDFRTNLGSYDYDGLHEFIRAGTRPVISIRSAVDGVRIIEAARVSLREKRAVELQQD